MFYPPLFATFLQNWRLNRFSCGIYRSCSVVLLANFKDIVMFSMKACSIPLNKSCLLNNSFGGTLLDDKNNYMPVVTLTIIYRILVVWLCCTQLYFCYPLNLVG